MLEHAQQAWQFPAFRRVGRARLSEGGVGEHGVLLIQPMTYMNRSGSVLVPLLELPEFDVARDLLVVVDDAALDVGRVRFRVSGSAGGHNGLKSIEESLRTRDYARLRIGVGQAPPDVDLADWVLADFEPDDEQRVRESLPDLAAAVRLWIDAGTDAAANQFNR